MSAARLGRFFGALLVTGSVACGSVDQGRINIVDEDPAGGSDGSGGTGGTSGGSGGSAGTGSNVGGDDSQGGDGPVPVLPEPPVVVSISPDVGESDVEPTGTVVIEFSEGLDPSTVTSDSVIVYDGETPIDGELTYSGVKVEFTPDERLDLLGEYSVVVTTDITDASGTALEQDFSSAFTVRDGAWSESLVVENPTGALNRRLVTPVIDAKGNVLVVWGQTKPGENVHSVYGRYFSPGAGFGEPFEIDTAAVACDDISVGMNSAGEAIIAWSETHTNLEQVWARRFSGGRLSGTPVRIDATAVTNVRGTVSAVGEDGEAHVLWSFNDTVTKYNILASHAAAGEAWLTTPDIIYNYAGNLSEPALAFDPDGNGFVFFSLDADGAAQTLPTVYARRYLSAGGQWGNGSDIEGSDGADVFNPPNAAADADGGARVVFRVGQDVKVAAFSKASGFGGATTIDSLASSVESLPRVSSNGTEYLACWYQSASTTKNAYSALSDGGAFAAPELRSNGDFEVSYYGNAVSGLDRQGNGFVLFEQVNPASMVDIAYGRLIGINKEWSDGSIVNTVQEGFQDPRIAVAPNGIAVAAWSVGIRLGANSIFVGTFE